MNQVINYAHRGASSIAPENTMPAFMEALLQGADGIECDVRLSRDGVPVVIHDEFVDRTTDGFGWVHEYTFAELQQLDAGSWFSPKYAGVKIPSLEELLAWLSTNHLLLNIEVKNVIANDRLEERILTLLHGYRMKERTVISSYEVDTLQRFRQLDAKIETAYIYLFHHEPWRIATAIKANALHAFYPFLTRETVTAARRHGLGLVPYTVDDWNDIRQVLQYEISGIITNYPNRVRKILHHFESSI